MAEGDPKIGQTDSWRGDLISISTKGQLISKCLFGVIVWTKKNNELFSRISALASKKRSNQKNKGTLLY